MKKLTGMAVAVVCLAFLQAGCFGLLKPDTKKVADNALIILRSMRGAAAGPHEPGTGLDRYGTDKVDSAYVDEIERGVRTTGWIFYDDGDTPLDSTDDIIAFRGRRLYMDWNVTENVWLSVHIWVNDRATEQAVKNITSGESSYVNLDKVNRPGGIQSGPAFWTNGQQSVDMTMGVHHNETPDNWADNYTYLEFQLSDENVQDRPFGVHADFRPDHSGSGEIRDVAQSLVATFEWDNFGRGSLVVDGNIYPFRW
jgi:hypothetical protein